MLMLQYTFALPADYPMRTERERIAARAPQFDSLPELGWKAFLLRESGVGGATDNRYAPLYLWPSAEAAGRFLAGPLFAAVVQAFGQPAIDTAVVLRHSAAGAAGQPRWCASQAWRLDGLADLQARIAAFEAAAQHTPPGLHSAWLALDADRWVLHCHRLWCGDAPPAADSGLRVHEVAHFARPA